ncbi:MAG TPA: hypothetical protein PLM00_01475 [Spirochaetota bacterium]|nr:hypothetical protein [Spirochaetota bacterium]HPH03228.1 hypothetical protein [Spirochaetota bacterium]HPN82028.1 hypothetical protein [Spirochaetota bacterium]
MKKIAVLLFVLTLALAACGSKTSGDSAAAVGLAGNLIPENASFVGTADVPGLLKIEFIKKMSKDRAEFEKQLGIKTEDLGVMTFWATVSGTKEADAAFFTKGLTGKIIEKLGGSSQEYQGIKVYTIGDKESAVAEVAGYVVFGTLKSVKATIDASKGRNLASSGRDKEFAAMLSKTQGLVTFAFIPDAKMKREIQAGAKAMKGFEKFIEGFNGLALGIGHASKKLELRIAAGSSDDGAKAAAEMLSGLKEQVGSQIDGFAMMLGKEAAGAAKDALASFKAKANGSFLNLDLDVPEVLIDAVASQLAGMFGGMAGGLMK